MTSSSSERIYNIVREYFQKSSLTYQLLLHVNKPFSIFLFFSLVLLYFYKGTILPYQYHIRVMEFLIILAFAPIEAVRISWGSHGNLTETPAVLGFSLFMSTAVIIICLYLAAFQNYVLFIEEVLICIEGCLVLLESVIALALCGTFAGHMANWLPISACKAQNFCSGVGTCFTGRSGLAECFCPSSLFAPNCTQDLSTTAASLADDTNCFSFAGPFWIGFGLALFLCYVVVAFLLRATYGNGCSPALKWPYIVVVDSIKRMITGKVIDLADISGGKGEKKVDVKQICGGVV